MLKIMDEEVNQDIFYSLKQFLETYFLQEAQQEEAKWISSIDNGLSKEVSVKKQRSGSHEECQFENVRAIPGGRYGCA